MSMQPSPNIPSPVFIMAAIAAADRARHCPQAADHLGALLRRMVAAATPQLWKQDRGCIGAIGPLHCWDLPSALPELLSSANDHAQHLKIPFSHFAIMGITCEADSTQLIKVVGYLPTTLFIEQVPVLAIKAEDAPLLMRATLVDLCTNSETWALVWDLLDSVDLRPEMAPDAHTDLRHIGSLPLPRRLPAIIAAFERDPSLTARTLYDAMEHCA